MRQGQKAPESASPIVMIEINLKNTRLFGFNTSVSEPLYLLFNALYECSNGSCPPEYYYKTCDMMLRLQKDYRPELFDRACAICLENHLFTGKRLENVIKTLVHTSKEIESTATPNPTNHANMRGILFFQ